MTEYLESGTPSVAVSYFVSQWGRAQLDDRDV